MKFRMRKRKRSTSNQIAVVQTRPPQEITVNAADDPYDGNGNEKRWAIQKVFASHLFKISRKHLGDNRHTIRRRTSLADASTAGDTSVLRPNDQFLISETAKQTKPPMATFRITCGTNNSIVADANKKSKNALESSEGRCFTQRAPLLRCTGPQLEETGKHPPPLSPTSCSFWCPLMSVLPDSYNNELKALDTDNDGTPQKYGSLFLLSNGLKKKTDTKRNGIPKVITVVTTTPGGRQQRESSCCGAVSLVDDTDGAQDYHGGGDKLMLSNGNQGVDNTMRSFDTSIVRLEESLMRANLKADVEDKFETPMPSKHRPLEQSATAASVSSSISTHSSLKFGASIVKLPASMAAEAAKDPA